MTNNDRTTRAIVLSGGGANGAYEAGVLKALFAGNSPATGKKPIEADMFTGTSVGSFNAGVLVSRIAGKKSCLEAAEELEKIWLEKLAQHPEGCDNGAFRVRADFLDYLNPKCFLNDPTKPFREMAEDSMFFAREAADRSWQFITSEQSLARRSIECFDLASALSTTSLHHLIEESIDVSAIMSKDAKDLFIVATDWEKGKTTVFKNKANSVTEGSGYDVRQMTESIGHETILASTAIPGIFPPIKIKAKGDSKTDHFVDGGVLMNTPMSPAIRANANEIHVIYFDPKLEKLTPDYLPNTLDTINRFLFASVANLIKEDIQEVEKVNRQVAVASKIGLIIETLKKRQADDLDKKGAPVKDAIESAEKFADELAKRKLVTVHNYYPSESLGGILGLLDFKRDRMQRLVDLGVKDTEGHDCKVNGCVIPE